MHNTVLQMYVQYYVQTHRSLNEVHTAQVAVRQLSTTDLEHKGLFFFHVTRIFILYLALEAIMN